MLDVLVDQLWLTSISSIFPFVTLADQSGLYHYDICIHRHFDVLTGGREPNT